MSVGRTCFAAPGGLDQEGDPSQMGDQRPSRGLRGANLFEGVRLRATLNGVFFGRKCAVADRRQAAFPPGAGSKGPSQWRIQQARKQKRRCSAANRDTTPFQRQGPHGAAQGRHPTDARMPKPRAPRRAGRASLRPANLAATFRDAPGRPRGLRKDTSTFPSNLVQPPRCPRWPARPCFPCLKARTPTPIAAPPSRAGSKVVRHPVLPRRAMSHVGALTASSHQERSRQASTSLGALLESGEGPARPAFRNDAPRARPLGPFWSSSPWPSASPEPPAEIQPLGGGVRKSRFRPDRIRQVASGPRFVP